MLLYTIIHKPLSAIELELLDFFFLQRVCSANSDLIDGNVSTSSCKSVSITSSRNLRVTRLYWMIKNETVHRSVTVHSRIF